MEIPAKDKAFIAEIFELARENYARDGLLAPVFFVESSEGTQVIPFGFKNQTEKEAITRAIKSYCVKTNAWAVIMLSEGWSLPQEDVSDFTSDPGRYGSVRNHPRAFQVVSVLYENLAGQWMGTARVEGRILRDIDWQDTKDSKGTFTGFLSKMF
jgi:hypothetical protein